MWSSVVIFILTFAILGLLLGFASVYNANSGRQSKSIALQDNITVSNMTQSAQPNNSSSGAGQ
jgi:hypothetical protein